VDGTRTRVEGLISAGASSSAPGSRPFVAGSPPFETSDAEMVSAAARAMLEGRGELAEFFMREVRQRRERRACGCAACRIDGTTGGPVCRAGV
jgi:hypothetical protein